MHRFTFSTRRRIAIESKTTQNSHRTVKVVKKANLYECFPWPPFPRFSFLLRINLTNKRNVCKIISCGVRCMLRPANAFSCLFPQCSTEHISPIHFNESWVIFLIKSPIKTLDSPLHHIWFLARHLNPTYYDKMKLQRLSYCCRWKNAFEFRSCKLTQAMWRSFLNSQSPNTVCIRLFLAFAFQNRLTKLCVSQGRGSKTLYYKLQLSPIPVR